MLTAGTIFSWNESRRINCSATQRVSLGKVSDYEEASMKDSGLQTSDTPPGNKKKIRLLKAKKVMEVDGSDDVQDISIFWVFFLRWSSRENFQGVSDGVWQTKYLGKFQHHNLTKIAIFFGLIFSRWRYQIFFIFTPTCGNDLFWLLFFKWVETTNQFLLVLSRKSNLATKKQIIKRGRRVETRHDLCQPPTPAESLPGCIRRWTVKANIAVIGYVPDREAWRVLKTHFSGLFETLVFLRSGHLAFLLQTLWFFLQGISKGVFLNLFF